MDHPIEAWMVHGNNLDWISCSLKLKNLKMRASYSTTFLPCESKTQTPLYMIKMCKFRSLGFIIHRSIYVVSWNEMNLIIKSKIPLMAHAMKYQELTQQECNEYSRQVVGSHFLPAGTWRWFRSRPPADFIGLFAEFAWLLTYKFNRRPTPKLSPCPCWQEVWTA